MGIRTRERLAPRTYVTDETDLLLVLDIVDDGQAIVENARTGEVSCLDYGALHGWRVVEPER